MAMTGNPIVLGIFRDRTLAEQAIEELRHAGIRDDEIRLAGQGSVSGGLIDHLANTLVGEERRHENLNDELVSKSVPEDEADYYQQEYEAGRTVVIVESYGHWREARDILHRFGAYDASAQAEQQHDERIIPLREEELHVHKQKVKTGVVVVRKEVITEEKTIIVPVTREELVIERRPGPEEGADLPESEGEAVDEALKDGGTLRIVLREERVRVEKYPVVKEEIFISKQQIHETRHIDETIKREEAHIEPMGRVNIQDSNAGDGAHDPEPGW